MLSIFKLFLINEEIPGWSKASTMNTRGMGAQIKTGRPNPTATVEAGGDRNALRHVVKSPPKEAIGLGMKPFKPRFSENA